MRTLSKPCGSLPLSGTASWTKYTLLQAQWFRKQNNGTDRGLSALPILRSQAFHLACEAVLVLCVGGYPP